MARVQEGGGGEDGEQLGENKESLCQKRDTTIGAGMRAQVVIWVWGVGLRDEGSVHDRRCREREGGRRGGREGAGGPGGVPDAEIWHRFGQNAWTGMARQERRAASLSLAPSRSLCFCTPLDTRQR